MTVANLGQEIHQLIPGLQKTFTRHEHSELHIVHAWPMAYEPLLRSKSIDMETAEVNQLVAETRGTHKRHLNELLKRYDAEGLSAKVHLLKGDPAEVIVNVAQENDVELIVMGTVARTGIPGFFIGNTAEKTLAAVDCSVLAVKPKAFSTPVEA